MNPAHPNLARKTLRGIGVSYGSAVLTGVMQIATTSVVARMVAPHEFGVLAMAQLGVKLASYFSQFGIGSALIQKRDLSESDAAAAHVLAVAAGIFFTVAGVFLAPLGRGIFHSDEVVWVIRALAVTFLLSGSAAAPLNLLRRHLRFGVISAIELTAYAVGYAAPCLLLVLLGHGLWGLVAGNLGSALVQLCLYHWAEPVSWKWVKDRTVYRGLLAYGSKISATGFLEYITSSMDSFFIGRYLGPKPLGLYTRAANLATTPLYMITSAVSRVLFPAFSRVQQDTVKLAQSYRDSLTLLFVLIAPLGLSLVPAAPQVVRLLLGPRWAAAALPLAVFGVTVPFNMAQVLPGIVLDATGTLTRKLHVRFATLAGAGALLYLNRNAGIVVIAELMLATSVVTFLAYHYLVVRQLRISWSAAVAPMLFGACTGAIPLISITWLNRAFPLSFLPALAADAVVLMLSYVLIIAFSPFPVVNNALSRMLAAARGEDRRIPADHRSRCLAWQLFASARAEGRC